MGVAMKVDYRELMWAEVDDIGRLLHELNDDEFDEPTLCAGWLVRDVIGHMSYGHTANSAQIMAGMMKYRFNLNKGSFALSKAFAAGQTADELRAFWDERLVDQRTRHGIARTIQYHEGFLDHFIHNQDIRRPRGHARDIPPERLVAALDAVTRVRTPLFSTKPKVAGLRLEATDIDWGHGEGPVVRGAAEALVMASAGRVPALDELAGEGVATLTDRVTP